MYRIEWDTTEVRYYVDGALVATHGGNFGATQMRPIASDLTAGGGELSVDWLRMSPYPASGTFESRVFDSGTSADWGALSWNAATPAGTAIAISVRTGDTPTPDGSWSAFTEVANSGGDIPGNSRYVQYRAELSTSDTNRTPTLSEVSIAYSAEEDTTAPTITDRSPAPGATGVTRDANVTATFSEPIDPATVDAASFRLRRQGTGDDVPASVSSSGSVATLNPDADLAANAVYEVTVAGTVKDVNGNPLGAADTWTFTTAPQTFGFTDTTVADFSAGTPDLDTYVSETANGEVILRPTVGEEFSGGPALPAGWSSGNGSPWTGGAAGVSSGSLHADGAYASTDATFGPGPALEFEATFGAQTFQHVGLSDNFNSAWAIFSTNQSTSQLQARTSFGGNTDVGAPGQFIGNAHLYRIEWDANEVRFFVDGNPVATHGGNFGATQMRPIASDLTAGGPDVSVDWMRMSPYPASGALDLSGTFDSRVFDSGTSADWGALSWNAATPTNTAITISVRTGNTPTPDGSWSAFAEVANSGDDIPGNSRYVQYRAELSTSDPNRTPALNEVSINGTEGVPPTAVDDTATVAEDSGASPIDVLANDLNGDGGPLEITAVTQPDHGTVEVNGAGSELTYRPDGDYCNTGSPTDDFTYTVNGGSTATVAVRVDCADDDPTAVDDTATVAEDSGASPIDVLANDLNGDGGPLEITAVTQPDHGTVEVNGAGSELTYRPDGDYCNTGSPTDDFTYTVNGGSTATVAVRVDCADDDPTAVDDTATVAEDSGASPIDVLANDLNGDGGPLEITAVTQPDHGTVEVNGAGSELTYRPDGDYCNTGSPTDDFTYTVNGGSTATVAVRVDCADDDPTAVDDTATVAEDSGASPIDVLANDLNGDGGPLEITAVTQPDHGTVEVNGAGSELTYRPDGDYCNTGAPTDDFTYTVNGGSTATVAVRVDCADDDPTAVDDTATVAEDSGASPIDVLANDLNGDGGPLEITAVDPARPTAPSRSPAPAASLTYRPERRLLQHRRADRRLHLHRSTAARPRPSRSRSTCVDDPPVAVDDTATVAEDSGATPDRRPRQRHRRRRRPARDRRRHPARPRQRRDHRRRQPSLTYRPDADYCPGRRPTTSPTPLNGGSTATVAVRVDCVDDAPVRRRRHRDRRRGLRATPDRRPRQRHRRRRRPARRSPPSTQPAHGTVAVAGAGSRAHLQPRRRLLQHRLADRRLHLHRSPAARPPPSRSPSPASTTRRSPSTTRATVAEDSGATPDRRARQRHRRRRRPARDRRRRPSPPTAASRSHGAGTRLTYTPDADYCNTAADDDFTYTAQRRLDRDRRGHRRPASTTRPRRRRHAHRRRGLRATRSTSSPTTPTSTAARSRSPPSPSPPTAPSTVTGAGSELTYRPDGDYCNPAADRRLHLHRSTAARPRPSRSRSTASTTTRPPSTTPRPSPRTPGRRPIDVLANDTDVDGGPLEITAVTQPDHGTVEVNGAGSELTYRPDGDYCNTGSPTDDFTYTVNGGSTATVAVTVDLRRRRPDRRRRHRDRRRGLRRDARSTSSPTTPTSTAARSRSPPSPSPPTAPSTVTRRRHASSPTRPDADYCNTGSPTDDFTYTVNGGSTATVAVTVDLRRRRPDRRR